MHQFDHEEKLWTKRGRRGEGQSMVARTQFGIGGAEWMDERTNYHFGPKPVFFFLFPYELSINQRPIIQRIHLAFQEWLSACHWCSVKMTNFYFVTRREISLVVKIFLGKKKIDVPSRIFHLLFLFCFALPSFNPKRVPGNDRSWSFNSQGFYT